MDKLDEAIADFRRATYGVERAGKGGEDIYFSLLDLIFRTRDISKLI